MAVLQWLAVVGGDGEEGEEEEEERCIMIIRRCAVQVLRMGRGC